MAQKIQDESDQAVWVSIPKAFMDAPNPLSVPSIARDALSQLQSAGYTGDQTFIGGHSLGGVFLPNVVDKNRGLKEEQVLGFIRLGAFAQRDEKESEKPSLTLCGAMDGMVRTSRIAEHFQRSIVAKGDTEETRLAQATVLVKGMNHFAFLTGNAPFMKTFRDLEADISPNQACFEVGSTIADFIDTHQQESSKAKASSLLSRIEDTREFIAPILEAMELEGSYHIQEPDFKDEGLANVNFDGSQWVANAQEKMAPALGNDKEYGVTKNEIHRCWFLNPLAEVKFYHPSIDCDKQSTTSKVNMNTVSELVYEATDSIFDGGFFSNAPSEIRAKFNSPQAILEAAGVETAEPTAVAPENFAKELNAKTIEWALAKVPEQVRQRYLERGVLLHAGKDLEQNNGPSWIWSSLAFRPGVDKDGRRCRFLDSPTMKTATDHPIPAVGGKVYCKLLSPSKALDWIYTDSLRPPEPQNMLQSVLSSMMVSDRQEVPSCTL